MKHIPARIAATLCAAAAALCTAAAMPASAINSVHPHTEQTQEATEFGFNFSHSLYWLQYHNPQDMLWNETVRAGLVLGQGYVSQNISGTQQGAALTGSAAWARKLAYSYYGEYTVFTEQPVGGNIGQYLDITAMKQGDQIVTHRNGVTTTYFVTGVVPDAGKFYCSELSGGRVKWNIEFTRTESTMTRTDNGRTYVMDYFIRPVKEGDVNGDSVVNFSDFATLDMATHTSQNLFPGADYNVLMGAADLDGDWQITAADVWEIYQNCSDERMNGDYRYVTVYH